MIQDSPVLCGFKDRRIIEMDRLCKRLNSKELIHQGLKPAKEFTRQGFIVS